MKKISIRSIVIAVLAVILAAGIAYVAIDSLKTPRKPEKKNERLVPILTGPEGVVAKVGKVNVTLKEYADKMTLARISYLTESGKDIDDPINIELNKSIRQGVLDSLIEHAVYKNYALEKGISITEREISEAVNAEIDSEITISGGRDKYEKKLKERGIASIDKLRSDLKTDPDFLSQLIKNKVKEDLQKNVKITEEQAKAFYEARLVGISKIVLWYDKAIDPPELEKGGREAIEKIHEMIGTKGTFEDIATNFSEDPATAPNGGKVDDLFIKGSLPLEMEEVVWKMKVGEVSRPFMTSDGFVIVRLDFETYVWQYYFPDKANKKKIPFEQIKEQVANQLFTVKVLEAENEWFNNYKNALGAEIYIKYENEEIP